MVLLLLLHINILCICQPALSSQLERKEQCVQLTYETEGPYWVEENMQEANLKGNLSYGVPLNLTFRVVDGQLSSENNRCEPIPSVRIDLWQCRYDGLYSDEAEEGTEGETWLRGYQYTNSTGYASFTSIYPGWYTSRTVHIHVRVRAYNEDNSSISYESTTQLFFDDAISIAIFKNVYPYNARGFATRDTYNSNDTLFLESNVIPLVGDYSNQDGYSGMVEFKLPLFSPMEGGGERHPTLT